MIAKVWVLPLSDEKVNKIDWSKMEMEIVPSDQINKIKDKFFRQVLKLLSLYYTGFEP